MSEGGDLGSNSQNDGDKVGALPTKAEFSKSGKKSSPPPVMSRPSSAVRKRTAVKRSQQDVEQVSDDTKTSPQKTNSSSQNGIESGDKSTSDQPDISMSSSTCVSCVEVESTLPSTSRQSYRLLPQSDSGAVARSYVQQVSQEEQRIGEQTRLLLNVFIQDRSRVDNTPIEPKIRELCEADKMSAAGMGFTDEALTDIALTLRKIGDDISQNVELNNLFEKVPVHSTRDIFMKVCLQIFQGGNLNWGRVVALFYFAYRLIVRTLSMGLDHAPWVRQLLTWAVDFIVKNVASWIISKGGWIAIKEWFGISKQTWTVLLFCSLTFAAWAYFKKK